MVRTIFLSLMFTLTLLAVAGCDSAESLRVEEVRTKMVGTWFRELEAEGAKTRRILVLGADGKFTDQLASTTAGGSPEHRSFSGEWSYDGTNLKRRYLQENGRKFSGGGIRFATFPLAEISKSELILNDSIDGQKLVFQRVP